MAESDSRTVPNDIDAPVGLVAARTLRKRFDAVWNTLRAACAVPDQAEHVHQLRVATRRALAAIEAFRNCVPGKRREWLEKRLRRLRKAAGEARDLDVLAERLERDASAHVRGRLAAMLAKQRFRSHAPIRKEMERCLDDEWESHVESLLEQVRGRRRQTSFKAHARRTLKSMIDGFFSKADRKLRDNDDIHALRIEGKKLRYALEIFSCALPRQAEARCRNALEKLQATLGDFTDHTAAAARFSRWARGPDAGPHGPLLAALCEQEDRHADRARKAFCKWWNPSRRRALKRRFERTLRHRSA